MTVIRFLLLTIFSLSILFANAQTPYIEVVTLPGKVEAEYFDNGGSGVAYHRVDKGNHGRAIRAADSVDIEACNDAAGGYNIFYVTNGDWYKYSVNVSISGAYMVTLRENANQYGDIEVIFSNGTVTTNNISSIPVSEWTNFRSSLVNLNAGDQTMQVKIKGGNYLTLNYIKVDYVGVDTQAPSTPTLLNATNITATSLNLNWAASTDNVDVTGYDIYKSNQKLATTSNTYYQITGLTKQTIYQFYVKAFDASANFSTVSQVLTVTTTSVAGADIVSPTPPTVVNVSNLSATGFSLSWSGATDNTTVAGYLIYLNGQFLASVVGLDFDFKFLKPSTNYEVTIKAYDGWGNVSNNSAPNQVQTKADLVNPSPPSALSANYLANTSFILSWNNSTDDIGVSGYQVFKNGNLLGTTSGNYFQISGLNALVANVFYVKALDFSLNVSEASKYLTVISPEGKPVFKGMGIDIGNVQTSGSDETNTVTGVNIVRGAGTVMGSEATGNGGATSDAFRFYYKKMGGDFEMIAQVESMDYTNYHANAGVMVRASLDANSRYGAMYIAKGQPYLQFAHRSGNGVGSALSQSTVYSFPCWLKIVRTGGSISGWYSSDGINWLNTSNGEGIGLPDSVFVGLAVTSKNLTTANQVVFKDATLVPLDTKQPAPSAEIVRNKSVGSNFWYLYSLDSQKDPAVWTGGHVWKKENPDFANDPNPWSQYFLNNIKIYQTLRFMDWTGTNDSKNKEWTKRTIKSDIYQGAWSGSDGPIQPRAGYATNGIAYEWLIDLSNRNKSDMWLNLPHLTIDPRDFPNGDDFNNEYAHKLAILLKHGLDMKNIDLKSKMGRKANLNLLSTKTKGDFKLWGGVEVSDSLSIDQKIYIEYSNEIWIRTQADYCYSMSGIGGLGSAANYAAWAELRMYRAFQDVFGSTAMNNRVIRVAGPFINPVTNWVSDMFSNIYSNATKNPWIADGVKPDAWKWDTYINPGYRSNNGSALFGNNPNIRLQWSKEVAASSSVFASMKTFLKSNYNLNQVSYEGGQHFERYAGEFNTNPASYEMYYEWISELSNHFDIIMHYGHYGKWVPNRQDIFSNWGAISYEEQPLSLAHKYRALRNYVQGFVDNTAYNSVADVDKTVTGTGIITSSLSGTADLLAPSIPIGLSSSNITIDGFQISWNQSSDNVGVTGYEIAINETTTILSGTSFTFTGLSSNSLYVVSVRAFDKQGNYSNASEILNVTTTSEAIMSAYASKEQINEIIIYPQPSQNEINLSFNSFLDQQIHINISDDKGMLLKQLSMSIEAGNVHVSIPHELPNGMYIMCIEKEKMKYFKKIMIVK